MSNGTSIFVAKRKKILIVDDDPGVCGLLSEFLTIKGYETLTAEDGQDGFEKAVQSIPNLIFLDILMPKMDGWQALTHLRDHEKTKDIPVVMLTAKGDTDALLKSETAHAVDYFIKPVNLEELAAFIKRYIDLRG